MKEAMPVLNHQPQKLKELMSKVKNCICLVDSVLCYLIRSYFAL